jgi:hypothetical protein
MEKKNRRQPKDTVIIGKEATHRDIEILQHCEEPVRPFGVALVAAVEE